MNDPHCQVWECWTISGEHLGPLSFEALKELVRQGQIEAVSFVKGDDGLWREAFHVEGLIEKDEQPPTKVSSPPDDSGRLLIVPVGNVDDSGPSLEIYELELARSPRLPPKAAQSVSAWYYFKKGVFNDETAGPISDERLLKYAFEGKVKPETLVRHPTQTKNQWIALKHIPAALSEFTEGKAKRQKGAAATVATLGQQKAEQQVGAAENLRQQKEQSDRLLSPDEKANDSKQPIEYHEIVSGRSPQLPPPVSSPPPVV